MLDHLKLDNKKVFFASDMHLGAPDLTSSRERENKLVDWLGSIQDEAAAIVLVGDIFDFWYEYKKVVPRGFVRFFGKIANLTDAGIPVVFFTGNHDLWMRDYFKEELNVTVYHSPQVLEVNGMKLLVGHGDGLGKGDYSYKLLKKIFTNPICIWLFGRFHPNFSFSIAHSWSHSSRLAGGVAPFDRNTDYLYNYCKEIEEKEHYDYYVFGHRHLPINEAISPESTYFNIGEWIIEPHYGVLDKDGFKIHPVR